MNLLVSNLVYIKLINQSSNEKYISHENLKIKNIRLVFPLLFIPAYNEVLKNVHCRAYNFTDNLEPVTGVALNFNEDNQTIECQFGIYFEFRKYYFAITIDKDV